VGFLDKAERSIEAAVSSLFARFSNAELQPVEISQAVKNAMDLAANKSHIDRILVPHRFRILVNPVELSRVTPQILSAIKTEIAKHAASRSYRLTGEISLEVKPDDKIKKGSCKVGSAALNDLVRWQPVITISGERHALKTGNTTFGRDESADITIGDRGLSRVHFEIAFDGEMAAIRDLGSTNGTFVDQMRITELVLHSGSRITAGRTECEFELLALAGEISE
jgi:hypothetical protein